MRLMSRLSPEFPAVLTHWGRPMSRSSRWPVLGRIVILPSAGAPGPGCGARRGLGKLKTETLPHYQSIVRINTSNPPGNETAVVNYLKDVLDREGIPYKIFAQDPSRANLVARLKGNGSKRPILIMGHTDTVGVQP